MIKIPPIQTFLLLFLFHRIGGVARFAIKSVSTRSVVIEMVDAHNVSRFDMRVLIYDLEKLREFRRSELTGARYNAQLFSFDGLIPGNWFAFRIEYRLVYDQTWKKARGSSMEKDGMKQREHSLAKDLSTKQELVVRTRLEIKGSGKNLPISTENIPPPGMDIDDELVQFNRVQLFPEMHQLNLSLSPVLRNRERISTLIVAELRCARGTVKPPAQQMPDRGTTLSFDLKRIHPGPLSLRNALARLKCQDLCIFPFIRIEPPAAQSSSSASEEENNKRKSTGQRRQTFRAREICESLEENEQPSSSASSASSLAERKWPAAATDELQQKLLDRHFRSSTPSASPGIRMRGHGMRAAKLMAFAFPFIIFLTNSLSSFAPFQFPFFIR